jgi:hypothetical protein
MLGNNTSKFIEDFDPEEIRTFLILHSAGYRRLTERIRINHNLDPEKEGYSRDADSKLFILKQIPEESLLLYDTLVRRDMKPTDEKLNGWLKHTLLKKDIDQVLEELPIKHELLLRSLSGYPESRTLGAYGLPVYHASKETPITEEGTYIKVTPMTYKATILASYEHAWFEFEQNAKMANYVGYDPNKRPKRVKKTATRVIDRYLDVESYMYDFLDKEFNTYLDEEVRLKLKDAFSAVANKHNVDSSTISNSYYDLQKRFFIPKLKQFEKLVVITS